MGKRRITWDWKQQQREVKKAWDISGPKLPSHLQVIEGSLVEDYPSLLASCLDNYGTVIARRGMLQVFQGQVAGWADVHAAWRHLSWKAQVMIAEGKHSWEDVMPLAARALAGAIAFDERRYAEWCGAAMLQNHRDPAIDYDPFHAFLVTLFARWQKDGKTL